MKTTKRKYLLKVKKTVKTIQKNIKRKTKEHITKTEKPN